MNKSKRVKILAEVIYNLFKRADSEEKKREVIKKIAAYLVKKRLLFLVPKLKTELESIEKKDKGILEGDLTSASHIDPEREQKIVKWISDYFKKGGENIKINFKEDKSLLGGFVFKTESVLIDKSLRSKLNQLSKKLTL